MWIKLKSLAAHLSIVAAGALGACGVEGGLESEETAATSPESLYAGCYAVDSNHYTGELRLSLTGAGEFIGGRLELDDRNSGARKYTFDVAAPVVGTTANEIRLVGRGTRASDGTTFAIELNQWRFASGRTTGNHRIAAGTTAGGAGQSLSLFKWQCID